MAAPRRPMPYLVLGLITVAALVLRWQFVDVESGDYRTFVGPWFQHLATSGFAGLADNFSNYNTPYLVLLWLATKLPFSQLVSIKLISVVFDLLLGFFAYRIVRLLRPAATWLPVIIAGVVLLLPTVVLNSSAWAQCDSIYASLCLGAVWLLLRRNVWLACALFGLAFAFKLQAVFLLPLLVGVLIVNRMRLRALIMVPVTFFAALGPAWIAGRGLLSQLAVYPAQISGTSNGGRGGGTGFGGPGAGGIRAGGMGAGGMGGGRWTGGQPGGTGFTGTSGSHAFTDNAPTWYAWLPSDVGSVAKYAGLGLAAAVILGLGIWLLRRRQALRPGEVVLLAAAATLVIPFLLPDMHERYFYLGEVLAVVAIVVDRRYIAVAAAIQIASISTYVSYLTGTTILPLGVSAVFAGLAAAGALGILIHRLHGAAPDHGTTKAMKVGEPAEPQPASSRSSRA